MTLRAGAEYARPEAPKGARLHPLRLKIDRLRAEAKRVERNAVGDWECALARIGREINLTERKLSYATR